MQQQVDELLDGLAGDQFFAAALREFNEGSHDRAVFARAIANSDGSDAAIKAQYIRMRTQRLAAEFLANLPPKISPAAKFYDPPSKPIYEQLPHAEKSVLWQEFCRSNPENASGGNRIQSWRAYLINRGYILPK